MATKKTDQSKETKQRPRRSYLQLKVNVTETTPTGAVIIDVLRSEDAQFLKQYGLAPKVTRANRLLWLAYRGITQSHSVGSERIENTTPIPISKKKESVPKPVKQSKVAKITELPKLEEAVALPKPELTMMKATSEDEEDDLDEGALMAGLM
ncbi:MAG: hypothetical protein KAH77_10330 [Thiomargarita sp.]|nr:hypothetical protein [Thiomargarita sp.]